MLESFEPPGGVGRTGPWQDAKTLVLTSGRRRAYNGLGFSCGLREHSRTGRKPQEGAPDGRRHMESWSNAKTSMARQLQTRVGRHPVVEAT